MREQIIENFLNEHGWGDAKRNLLAQDASFRKFDRLQRGDTSIVLMDAPPPMEKVEPFINIAGHLNKLGFNAPDIIARNIEHGLLLVEDFGDDTFTKLLTNEHDNEDFLYSLAIDVLTHLHQIPAEQAILDDMPSYDLPTLSREVGLLTEWYMPAITGQETPPEVTQSYQEAWLPLFNRVQCQPQTLVLRDFHVDNLIIIKGQNGIRACGLLDIQDALAGPRAYDLISILEDARRDISDELRTRLWQRYLAAMPEFSEPGPARDELEAMCAIMGAQRHAKIIGIFTRLYKRDNKPAYLTNIPRVWKLLERSVQHPALIDIKDWLDHHIPPPTRLTPDS